MVSFALEAVHWGPQRNHHQDFGFLVQYVNPVDHGEFQAAADTLIEHAGYGDDITPNRPSALAIQRCRRGGKTFMLHAIAARLTTLVDDLFLARDSATSESSSLSDAKEEAEAEQKDKTHVIFITMNNKTPYDSEENALQAILGRIAYEYSGAQTEEEFDQFRVRFTDFDAVRKWVTKNKIILLIDELNAIEPPDLNSDELSAGKPRDDNGYKQMSQFLNTLVGRQGSALLYSTHLRDTSDLLRNRFAGPNAVHLSMRRHKWVAIPRIVNECCLRGLNAQQQREPSFWSVVLKGRLPALLLQEPDVLKGYGQGLFPLESTSDKDRISALKAVITGNISELPSNRALFKAYSYMSERFYTHDNEESPLFAWPPFLVAQWHVIGKNCGSLRTSLADPSIDESKAFEALTQLSVLVRLLSAENHQLVPHNEDIPTGGSFAATEIYHVGSDATTIDGVIFAVKTEFCQRPHILQVVAVPYFASFPLYDFFVLHRNGRDWVVAAGYQCKQGTERPSEDATPEIPLSVWIEGKCRKYRVGPSGSRVDKTLYRGWVLLGESAQASMLGVSVSEALPAQPLAVPVVNLKCSAELVWAEKQAAATEQSSTEESDSSPETKKARTS